LNHDEKEGANLNAISVSNLCKVYKDGKKALADLSIEVKEGEIFALLGPNGTGKSTLINVLTTFLRPTSGKILVMGKDLYTEQKSIRPLIACVAQKVSIDDHLSLRENMLFQGRLYKLDKAAANKRMDALITEFGLNKYEKDRVIAYSGGIKRRLDIAMSMMSYPKILFLDEPTVGMDIESRQAMWDVVKKIKTDFGTTIFLTTHYLEEANVLSDTVCIMQNGHELVQDTPENLRKHTRKNIIRVDLESSENQQDIIKWISSLQFVKGIRKQQNTIYANTENPTRDFRILNQLLMDKQTRYSSIGVITPSLDDVFLSLTQNKGGQ
jgi:ABC-2 type transport system ATP-binding protein